MSFKHQEQLIVALDTPSLDFSKKIIQDLAGSVSFFKVGFELFTAHGWKAVELVKKQKARIFLDLKLHDIPNTVSRAAAVIAEYDVDLFNVHALGGLEMMKKAQAAVLERTAGRKQKPSILGVTILTSHSEKNLREDLGIERSLNDQVLHLARLVRQAGLAGVVSSPKEIGLLRREFPKDFLIVTPGIRGAADAAGDQKRTFSAREAIDAGADYLVVGRPITAAKSPAKAARQILESLQ